MKRKKAGKVLGILLTVTMVFGLAGCGSQNQQEAESAPQEQQSVPAGQGDNSSEETGEASVQKTESGEAAEITYPLQTDDKLTLWSKNQMKWNNAYSSYTESPFHTKLAERTGVEVDWQFPAEGADMEQAYNLLLAEEVLPDIIFTSIDSGGAEQLINDGVIYDLTEYLPKYAPDYWEVIHRPEYANVLQSLTTDSGKFYGVEGFCEDNYNITYMGPVVRKDWLDECGLDIPVTMDDWEEVLVAFKEKYNAALGFYVARINNIGIGSGTGAYATFSAEQFIDDDGKVQLAQTQQEWKEYMEYLHRWWDMGLIDKDSLSMDDAAMRTKVLNNEIGISFTACSQLTNWCVDAKNEGTGAEWIGIDYPRTAPGEPTCMIQTRYSGSQGWCAMVTTSCPEDRLITALKWMNYGYTDEGMMYWNFGTEGETYTLDENGLAQWTDLVANDPDTEARTKYIGTRGVGISVQLAQMVRIGIDPAAAEAVDKWISNTDAVRHCVPLIAMTDEENTRYSDLWTPIRTYVEQTSLKFMTGDESLDNYDKFLEELDGLGLQEALELRQAAYDRFIAK